MARWGIMKIATLRRPRTSRVGVTGVARLDRRTKRLVGRLNPGDIAIIDHADLDRVAADTLVAAKVSRGDQRPAQHLRSLPEPRPGGPGQNGIPLVDNVGSEVFGAVKEGTRVRIEGDTVFVGDTAIATGTEQDAESIAALMSRGQGRTVHPARGFRRRTRWSTCAGSVRCCSTASACPTSRPRSRDGTSWSWSGVMTTRKTCARCATTSASSARSSSGSTAAPTR